MGQFKPKLILLENTHTVRDHAKTVLTQAGWDVFCHETSQNALNMLEQSKEYLFALFISNSELPGMEGDDILEKVKAISPVTRRMLVVPSDRADILIDAVNRAEIHACITFPFKDEDLITQAANCFKQFKMKLKQQRLKRVTIHQNKQMLQIAQKLKKKDGTYKEWIEMKKAKKIALVSKIQKIDPFAIHVRTSLSAYLYRMLEKNKVTPCPEAFQNEFLGLSADLKHMLDQVFLSHSVQVALPDLKDSLDRLMRTQKDIIPLEIIDNILQIVLSTSMEKIPDMPASPANEADTGTDKVDHFLDPYFEITISDGRTKAYIKKIKDLAPENPVPTMADFLEFFRQKQILYGIIEDKAIQTWISGSFAEKIIIALGEKPVQGQDGKIEYFFKINFTNPGKINEDGTIDFRERGDIPYALKDSLLARKTPAKPGQAGMSVTGTPIPIVEPLDPALLAGPGTELSEDKLSIRALVDGQPHRDALGLVSITPDLTIPGDVDFHTGNIHFNGNIIVRGTVKEGFSVKGINLTAKEIEGAFIDITGDLNVSIGISESEISAQGHIYAKYVNHSTVRGFQNLVVQKEIIDSDILLSGSLKNPSGNIISSRVVAKRGIEAGSIGSASSASCKLKIGVDQHIETLKNEIDDTIENATQKITRLKSEIKKLEEQDQALYREISEKAHIQDRTQLEIKDLKKILPDLQKTRDIIKLQEASQNIKKLLERAKAAEKALNTIFDTQDKLANQIEKLKKDIAHIEEANKVLIERKKGLTEFSKKEKPEAVVTVAKSIMADTIIKGPHTSLILKENRSRCKIQETALIEDSLTFHEMIISDL